MRIFFTKELAAGIDELPNKTKYTILQVKHAFPFEPRMEAIPKLFIVNTVSISERNFYYILLIMECYISIFSKYF